MPLLFSPADRDYAIYGTSRDTIRTMTSRDGGRRRRVVVIDDDLALTSLIEDLLIDEGFQVLVHPRWDDAHQVVADQQPDMVLLDLRFGGVELGWRVVDRLTLDPTTRSIPVIVWSAALDSLRAHEPVLLAAHGRYMIGKPFDIEHLLATIERALAEHPARVLRPLREIRDARVVHSAPGRDAQPHLAAVGA